MDHKNGITWNESFAIVDISYESVLYQAGLRKGDLLTEVNGQELGSNRGSQIPIFDSQKDLYHLKWVQNGQELSWNSTLPKVFQVQSVFKLFLLIGICCLIAANVLFWLSHYSLGKILSVFMLLLGCMFLMGGVPLYSGESHDQNLIYYPIVLLGMAGLSFYLSVFPGMVKKKHYILFGPFVVWLLLVLSITLTDSTHHFGFLIHKSYLLILICYMIASLAYILMTFVHASPFERNNFGLKIMMAGLLTGLLPMIFVSILDIAEVPYSHFNKEYILFSLLAVPISLILGYVKWMNTQDLNY